MLTTKEMADVMYAMDIIATELDGGNRLADWRREAGPIWPRDVAHPTDVQVAAYERWLAMQYDAGEAFRDLVSAFVFLLCRVAFGRFAALLNGFVCKEEVF